MMARTLQQLCRLCAFSTNTNMCRAIAQTQINIQATQISRLQNNSDRLGAIFQAGIKLPYHSASPPVPFSIQPVNDHAACRIPRPKPVYSLCSLMLA